MYHDSPANDAATNARSSGRANGNLRVAIGWFCACDRDEFVYAGIAVFISAANLRTP